MQAIILAAGMGKRLGELTQNNTKCMVKVNGVTLIDRLMTQLSELSLKKIIIVIGYQGEKLRSYLGENYLNTKIEYIYNPIYDKTNNIYSLALAKESLQEDDSLLIESDLIFDDSLFRKIIDNPYPDITLVDKYESWMDGTMVTLDEENNIENFVSKKAFKYSDIHNYYKTVNIYKFSKEFSKHKYVPFLDAYCKALGHNEYYEQVLKVISRLDDTHLKALPLNGEKWYEIDDIQDLDIAETIFACDEDQLIKYQSRYGGYWRFPSLLDFCYLVNPYFPPKKMIEELKANFDILLTEYPSGMKINSLLAGKYFGIKSDYTCIGNGAAELIKSLMEKLDGKIGVIFPTFEEYPNRKKQEELVTYIPENHNFSYTAKDIMNYFAEKDIQTLLLINPDNPSGNFIPAEEVLELVEWTKKKNIRFIVDESFVDFAEDGLHQPLLLHLFDLFLGILIDGSLVCTVEHNSFRSILADHTTPEGIIQIENQHFLGNTHQPRHHMPHLLREQMKRFHIVRNGTHIPEFCGIKLFSSIIFDQTPQFKTVNIFLPLRQPGQKRIPIGAGCLCQITCISRTDMFRPDINGRYDKIAGRVILRQLLYILLRAV